MINHGTLEGWKQPHVASHNAGTGTPVSTLHHHWLTWLLNWLHCMIRDANRVDMDLSLMG